MKGFFLFFFLFVFYQSNSQVIKGVVRDKKGDVMPFASIWISNLNKGTLANEEGKYLINVPLGKHDITFRFLGHSPRIEKVTIELVKDYEIHVTLEEQAISLEEVNVGGLKEDPAIGIMRRMIAMAPFHLKELESYTAKGYVKGSGKVTSISKLMNVLIGKKLDKETGIKVGSTYVLEGINQISYKKPNKIEEKVLSSRNNLPSVLRNADAPNLRVTQTNFYQPKIWFNLISPLSPNAFQYYNFSYLGSFTQNGQTISKIQLTPKSSYNDLFNGTISVVEDTWSIYSFSLNFKNSNGSYQFTQQNALFKGVWMAVNYDVNSVIELMGFGATFRYITQIKEYNIQVNAAYVVKPQIIEERLKKSLAKEIDKEKIKNPKLELGGELTRKKLKKLLKEVDKVDKKEKEDQGEKLEFSSEYSMEVDSLANLRGTEYWTMERQVPLTDSEVVGYQQADSIYAMDFQKRSRDSIRNLPRFRFSDILTVRTYDYQKKNVGWRFKLSSIGGGFSAVDGYYMDRNLELRNTLGLNNYLVVGVNLRYAFARTAFNSDLYISRNFDENRQRISASLGSNIYQINGTNPVSGIVNQFYALFLSENYLKFYQKDFVNFTYENQVSSKFRFSGAIEYRHRTSLQNHVFNGWFNKEKNFSTNIPINFELLDTKFNQDDQFLSRLGIRWQPSATWRRYNKTRRLSTNDGPTLNFQWEFAMGSSDYSKFSFQINQRFNLVRLGDLSMELGFSQFLKNPSNFIDFQHFQGNELSIMRFDDFSFKALPFYYYSTRSSSVRSHVKWQPRKFLLTQSNLLNMYGLREHFVYSFLKIFNQNQNGLHQEISYGITGIGKIAGLEFVYPIGQWVPERFKVLVRLPF